MEVTIQQSTLLLQLQEQLRQLIQAERSITYDFQMFLSKTKISLPQFLKTDTQPSETTPAQTTEPTPAWTPLGDGDTSVGGQLPRS